jgi:hypothetical protein
VGAAMLGDTERAVHYSRLAAQQASESYDFGVAIAHLDAAIELSSRGTQIHVELLLDRAEAATRSGLEPSAMDTIVTAYELARQHDYVPQAARAVIGLEAARQLRGLPGVVSADMIRETLDLVDPGDVVLRIQLGAALVRALQLSGRTIEARSRGADVLTSARSFGRRGLVITALQAVTLDWDMDARRLNDLSRELCDLAQARRDHWLLCWGLSNLIRSSLMLGEIDEAIAPERARPADIRSWVASTSTATR